MVKTINHDDYARMTVKRLCNSLREKVQELLRGGDKGLMKKFLIEITPKDQKEALKLEFEISNLPQY